MKKTALIVTTFAVAIVPLRAIATAVTYEFIGRTFSESGIYAAVPLNTPVSGTFTLDLSIYDPSHSQILSDVT